jgi:hypothetical protein
MQIQATISSLALLAGIASAMTAIPAGHALAARGACPQFVTTYCVVDKTGYRHSAETNPCLAHRAGMRVLHIGACEGPICILIYMPVCSIDPATHMQKTYANQCWSDVNNATLVHKGACK